MVFGKNYDKDIDFLNEQIKTLSKNQLQIIENTKNLSKNLSDFLDSMQDNILKIAKVQAQHKHFIQFVTKHGNFDTDSQEDFMNMLKEIVDIDDIKFPKDKKK